MPRLLYLENSRTAAGEDPVVDCLTAMGVDLEIYRAYRGEFPSDLARYDGMYLTGSPHGAYDDVSWIHREHEVLAVAAASGLPMLGVCFGSQILASALCGRDQVFRRSTCEVGYVVLDVGRFAEDELLTGIADTIRMFVWHNDEVRATHPDMTIIARSADCPNHIWRFRDRPIWGIQGHPEVRSAVAQDWLGGNRKILERDGADVDALIDDRGADPEVDRFLSNFVASLVR